MLSRRLSSLVLILLAALVLAACGSEDDAEDPVADETEAVATEVAEIEGTAEDEALGVATSEAAGTVVAVTDTSAATPAVSGSPAGIATPVSGSLASPVASPIGVPAGSPAVASPEAVDADAGTPVVVGDPSTAGSLQALNGTVSLSGTANETFVLSDDGCVGLDSYDRLGVGRQVVVRDASGEIVAETALAATTATDTCEWMFTADVPDSAYYAVSIPMVLEHVVSGEDLRESDGEVQIPAN